MVLKPNDAMPLRRLVRFLELRLNFSSTLKDIVYSCVSYVAQQSTTLFLAIKKSRLTYPYIDVCRAPPGYASRQAVLQHEGHIVQKKLTRELDSMCRFECLGAAQPTNTSLREVKISLHVCLPACKLHKYTNTLQTLDF
jgi:hypothetical protein